MQIPHRFTGSIRMLFDWMVLGQALRINPASAVRGPIMGITIPWGPTTRCERCGHQFKYCRWQS